MMTDAQQDSLHHQGAIIRDWVSQFNMAVKSHDAAALARCFRPDGYWRDLLALTWDMGTVMGDQAIAPALLDGLRNSGATPIEITSEPIRGRVNILGETTETYLSFKTKVGHCRSYVRLVEGQEGNGSYQAITFLTSLNGLIGHPEKWERREEKGYGGDYHRGLENWLDRRRASIAYADRQPEVLIVGAGQAGLSLAARLGQQGIDTLVVDTMERIGDNWRNRYHTLTLHNQIYQNHLPYMQYPKTWPIYIPKDMIADWFEFYAKCMELNVWTSTKLLSASYDEDERVWTARLRRADGTELSMRPKYMVMAIGVSGIPNMPEIPGQNSFKGHVLHSAAYHGKMDVAGKKVLVVGAGNSAHDVAQELYLNGAEVTMLQRSSSTVVSIEPSSARATTLYKDNHESWSIDDLDLRGASTPFDLTRRMCVPLSKWMAEEDKELLDGLRRIGFRLDNGEDDTGFYMKLIRKLSGYYINVGASDLLVEGKIKLRHGEVVSMTEDKVILSDGSEMQADMVVFGTGWKPLNDAVAALFGRKVAERIGPIWGLGPKGELRNMWARTAQPGFYVAGGTLTMCRNYSRYTALLIKAELEGLIEHSA